MPTPNKLGSRARASMAMLAATLGAVAPVATVPTAPNAPTGPEISQTRTQAPQTQQMSRAQAIQANQALGLLDNVGFGYGPGGKVHQVPTWNQRKARRAARQTGRKIQKRYKR